MAKKVKAKKMSVIPVNPKKAKSPIRTKTARPVNTKNDKAIIGKRTCFVIMPFGEKKDVGGTILDFDDIYDHLIKPAVEDAKLVVTRSDEIEKPGWIHARMIEHIYNSDVAVVDITTLNANVFYELGVRHALRQSVTVLIRKKGTTPPFNIQNLNVIEYDTGTLAGVAEAKRKITEFITSGLSTPKSDSLVFDVLKHQIGTPQPALEQETYTYELVDSPDKKISIITGDIRNVKWIADIWVSSENTNMQMARYFDRSVSSVIRYFGADKDDTGHVTKDTIADELNQKVALHKAVHSAQIISTTAGQLEKTHGVKSIFHAAAVAGAIGRGYSPINNIADCVTNALIKADTPPISDAGLTTILFPLLGTGTAHGDLVSTVELLIKAAVIYLSQNSDSQIRHAYFLAWSQAELTACQHVLDNLSAVKRI